jgi:hypothetical protein
LAGLSISGEQPVKLVGIAPFTTPKTDKKATFFVDAKRPGVVAVLAVIMGRQGARHHVVRTGIARNVVFSRGVLTDNVEDVVLLTGA